jgi:NADP-dependent 3-hydroxy acid dehydrogenase YdfG
MTIKDSVIIITGASEGIGLATAKLLDQHGAKLVLAARSPDKLAAAAVGMRDVLTVPTDMRDPEAINNLIAMTLEKYGRIDALVNNAGQGGRGPVESIDIEQYKQLIELNVFGVLRAMQAVIPVMRQQSAGSIVNISSNVSKNFYPSLAMYASTKYALNAISLTARAELEKEGIIVSVMHPGLTATNFGTNALTATNAKPFDRGDFPTPDSAEDVAKKIAEALTSGVAEIAMPMP